MLKLKFVGALFLITVLVVSITLASACKAEGAEVIVETVTETVTVTEVVEVEKEDTSWQDVWEIPFLDVLTGGFAAAGVPGAWAIKEAEKESGRVFEHSRGGGKAPKCPKELRNLASL